MFDESQYPDITAEQKQLIISHLAEFEGKVTTAWYKTQEELGEDWGESDEENILFAIFFTGAGVGAEINNQTWIQQIQEDTNE